MILDDGNGDRIGQIAHIITALRALKNVSMLTAIGDGTSLHVTRAWRELNKELVRLSVMGLEHPSNSVFGQLMAIADGADKGEETDE